MSQFGLEDDQRAAIEDAAFRRGVDVALNFARGAVARHTYECSDCKDITCLRINMELRAAGGEIYATRVAYKYGDETVRALRAFFARRKSC